jgi:hypothetical protein
VTVQLVGRQWRQQKHLHRIHPNNLHRNPRQFQQSFLQLLHLRSHRLLQ